MTDVRISFVILSVVLVAVVAGPFRGLAAESTVVRVGERTEIVSAPVQGVDLGVIEQHRPVDCSFAVTNRNWRERKVLGVSGNCACLSTSVERKTLARGEVLPVKVAFNPAGMEGPVEKLVTLRLEGKDVEYPIRADVRLRLGFRPRDLDFGVVEAGTGASVPARSCSIGGTAATNAVLTLVPPPNPFFDVRLKDGVVTAAFREGVRHPGAYTEVWQVRTSDAELPLLKLPVTARVAGGLSVSPRRLELPRAGGPQTRQVLIRPAAKDGGAPRMKVLSAETRPRAWGDVTVRPRPLGGWLVRVDNIDPVAVRQFSKRPYLEITTDFPGMERFAVPLVVEDFTEENK